MGRGALLRMLWAQGYNQVSAVVHFGGVFATISETVHPCGHCTIHDNRGIKKTKLKEGLAFCFESQTIDPALLRKLGE